MKFTPLAVVALILAVACGGNKENANNPNGTPPTTTDTSAGQMSNPSANPNTTPAPSTEPATPPSTTDTTSHMTAPDTSMKKMSGKKHHKASSDTTTH